MLLLLLLLLRRSKQQRKGNTFGLMMLCGGRVSGEHTKTRRTFFFFSCKCGVFHAPARLELQGGTRPLEKDSQLIDVGCSRAPPRSSAGIEACVVMYRWAPCLPPSRRREKKTLGRWTTASQKKKYGVCTDLYRDLFDV